MIGDILMHQLATEGSFLSNTTYNFDYMFNKFNVDLSKIDINIVNLEINLCAKKFGIRFFPRFSNRFEIADTLVKQGYNVVLKATNHVFDHGKEGVEIELQQWKKKYPEIQVTGAYLTEEDSKKITYMTKKGIKIAIINYTTITNRIIPIEYSYLINYYRKEKLEKDVLKAKEEGAEYIVLCMHWGIEYSNKISEYQKNLVHYFYELGIDVVIGTHPHVIQPVQWYKEEGNDRKMLVYYSLGNFINSTENKGQGYYRLFCEGMAYIEIERNKTTGKIDTKVGKFVPLITHIDKNQDFVHTYLVRDYSTELAEENRVRTRTDSSFSYDRMINHFHKVIPKEFLYFNFTSSPQCGDEFGNCPDDQCCNEKGYCGTTTEFCSLSQGCQKKFGKCIKDKDEL